MKNTVPLAFCMYSLPQKCVLTSYSLPGKIIKWWCSNLTILVFRHVTISISTTYGPTSYEDMKYYYT